MRYAKGKVERLRARPAIVPVVFHHGEAAWSVADGLGAMMATDDAELVFLPGERFILRVRTSLPPEDLSHDATLGAGLIALTRRAVELAAMMVEGLEQGKAVGLEQGRGLDADYGAPVCTVVPDGQGPHRRGRSW